MKRFLSILSLVLLGFVSQSCYDDSALWESVNDLDSRVKTLETLCKEMNTNLASLQTLVSAMKQGDYIVDVAPLTENGVEVGYQITFYDRGTVNIYHGKDGVSSGDVPDFGAKQDADGKYYWTVNGEWILDDNGNKLPVSTAVGAAGVTPKLKVENGKWYVSYDEGKTWEEAGSAVSEDANACLFKDVQLTDEALVLTMSDGSVFTLPIGERFRIVFGEFDASTIQYGTDVVIPYTIEGAKGEVSVFVVSDGWMFETELVEETAVSGKLTIRQEDYYDEEISGKVAVFAVAEDGTTVSKVIRLLSGVLRPSSDRYDDVYTVESSASQLEFTVSTNRDFEVTTNADWITYASTKAVEEKTLVFDIQENENARRKTYVEIASGDIAFGFTVSQKGFSDAFSVNVSCDELRGGGWNVSIDTLFNKAGQTIYEVLGYSSWEELAVAAGGWDAVYSRTGEVILTAYDLYTGEALPYDARQFHNGLGFIHDSDGYLVSDWSLCKTLWDWSMIWDDTGSHLDKIFWINTNNVYAGESNSFGILFTAPEGEARIEVTVNVTEYVDPEKGLYDNPAAPGTYEFTLHDKVNLDSLVITHNDRMKNLEIVEIIKSTLGMTTYEISRAGYDVEYLLNNGERWSGFDVTLGVNGCRTDWNVNTMVAQTYWCLGVFPEQWYLEFYVPFSHYAVYNAIGHTVSYKIVFRYEGYELIFTHEIEFVGERNPYASDGRCLLVKSQDMVSAAWDTQFYIYFPDTPMQEGDSWEVSMNIRADKEASPGTQTHKEPRDYLHWAAIGNPSFKTEWSTWTNSGTVDAAAAGGYSIAFNLNDFAEANNYYFDNVSFKINGTEVITNGTFDESDDVSNFLMIEYPEIYPTPARIFDSEYPWYYYCLAGNNGQKVWRYAPDQTYGNAGNSGNGFGYENGNVDGMWWGAAPSDLISQLAHAGGVAYGDESPDAYMIFTDEGVVTTYTPSGAKVRSGMYEVNDYNPSRPDGWELGKLMTSEPALLFPWSMNEGGLGVTEYDIMDLTPEQMTLVYTKGNGSGSWGEITFWRFVSGEISEDIEPSDYTWYLVGDFNGWTAGDEAYRMTKDGDRYVYYGFTTSGAELKFNAGDWSVDKGADYFAADQAVPLVQGGMIISVPAGTYDIYLNADASEAYFMTVDSEDNGPANKVWSKEVTSYEGYDATQKVRLAKYGDNILLANTTKVYVLDPATGEAVNTIAMPKGVTAHSVLVDDAGNFMIAADAAYGATTTLYLVPDPTNPVPEELLSFDTNNYYCVEAGNFRVKGNVKDDAVVTLTVADGGSGAVIMWEFVDGQLTEYPTDWGSRSWDYVVGPYSGWAVTTTCAAPAGSALADGLFYIGYGGDYNLKYKASGADWVISYVTGSTWMENYNCISTAEWKGNKYAAIVMGCHFSYDAADAVLLDVNDPAAAKHLYTHYGDEDAAWDWDAGVNNSWTGLGIFSDVLLVPTEEALLMVYVDSNYGTIGCVAIRE